MTHVIKCRNTNMIGGERKECKSFVGAIGGDVAELKAWMSKNPGENCLIYRCHSCVPHQRWIRIYCTSEGDLVWDSAGETKVVGDSLVFDRTERSEFIA